MFYIIVRLTDVALCGEHHTHTYPAHSRILESPKSHDTSFLVDEEIFGRNLVDNNTQLNIVARFATLDFHVAHVFEMSGTSCTIDIYSIWCIFRTDTGNCETYRDTIFRFLNQTRCPYRIAIFIVTGIISFAIDKQG